MCKTKNYFKKTYADKKTDAKGNKLSEEIGKGINKEHKEKVLKARLSETVFQIRIPKNEKENFEKKCGKGNSSNIARILFKKYVNGEIE